MSVMRSTLSCGRITSSGVCQGSNSGFVFWIFIVPLASSLSLARMGSHWTDSSVVVGLKIQLSIICIVWNACLMLEMEYKQTAIKLSMKTSIDIGWVGM